jgi:hypothetical protein
MGCQAKKLDSLGILHSFRFHGSFVSTGYVKRPLPRMYSYLWSMRRREPES